MGLQQSDIPLLFLDYVGKPLRQAVHLSGVSSFRIGGIADFFFEAFSTSEFLKAIGFAREYRLPYYVIGGGYNLLFDDDGYRGLIVKNSLKGIKRKGNLEIEVASGVSLKELLQFCLRESLSGLEFLAGIPGTVGGAVFGNAGAFNQSLGTFLKKAVIIDTKIKEVVVDQEYFKFGYRQSFLKKKHVFLLKVVFRLFTGSKNKIENKICENLKKREKKHPPQDVACAGSYFKNPVFPDGRKVAAAALLDQVGAKKRKVGGAFVHPDHANFITNLDNASAKDVLQLAFELKKSVREKFGVELEEEVIFLSADSSMP
ncbi:UDP-N-acetylmuramate dehydrogenase [Acidobacteriota bacterium]